MSSKFFLKAYSITFQTSIFSPGSEKGFAKSKQKSPDKILKMPFLQGAKKKDEQQGRSVTAGFH
jgi:hypothetical protein